MAFSAAVSKRARRQERSGAGIEELAMAVAAVVGDDDEMDEEEDDDDDENDKMGSRVRRLAPTLRRPLSLGDLFRAQHGAHEAQRGRREIKKEFSCVGLAEGLGADELLFSDPTNDAVQRLVWSAAPRVRNIHYRQSSSSLSMTCHRIPTPVGIRFHACPPPYSYTIYTKVTTVAVSRYIFSGESYPYIVRLLPLLLFHNYHNLFFRL